MNESEQFELDALRRERDLLKSSFEVISFSNNKFIAELKEIGCHLGRHESYIDEKLIDIRQRLDDLDEFRDEVIETHKRFDTMINHLCAQINLLLLNFNQLKDNIKE
jgi:hypothetical protein